MVDDCGNGADDAAQRPPEVPTTLTRADLERLVGTLQRRGWQLIGPTVKQGAVQYAELDDCRQLPRSLGVVQEPGRYALRYGEASQECPSFAFAAPANSPKSFFHVPVQRLLRATRNREGFTCQREVPKVRRKLMLGVRSCELHAIAIQDAILSHGHYQDPHYVQRRKDTCLIVVNCVEPAATCFCASLNTGPEATSGFDIALTELTGPLRYVAVAGSARGKQLLEQTDAPPTSAADQRECSRLLRTCAARQTRQVESTVAREALASHPEHPVFDAVAERCIGCGNCTMVCPTCFCTAVENTASLTGQQAEISRRWESCFSLEFSYVHGGPVRSSVRSRYRQWLTHKFSTWFDQFGSAGCVGCGRCITWCPVGIDVTRELAALTTDVERTGHERAGLHAGKLEP